MTGFNGKDLGERFSDTLEAGKQFASNFNEYETADLNGSPVVINTKANSSNPSNITNWVTVLTLNTTGNKGGQYSNFNQALWKLNSTGKSALFRIVFDGTALPPIYKETKDVTDVNILSLTIHPNEFLSGWSSLNSHTIEVQAIVEGGGGSTPTLTIQDCIMSLERKA